jgi:hypothetical protein
VAHTSLQALLGTVDAVGPQEHDGLRVFGLRWASDGGADYATLDESLAAGTLEVQEVSAQGSVPTLKVVNRSPLPVFLMSGEHLVGAKQDRVLNASLMVPANSETTVPVSCVEAHRWHDRSRSGKFASKQTMSHGHLRAMMSTQTQQGYRAEGSPTSDQGKVWREVERKLGAMGSKSPTQAFGQVYDDHSQRLEALVARFWVPEGCHGAAFAVNGQIVGADVFDRPETLEKLWVKLLRAYALDVLEPVAANPDDPAQAPASLSPERVTTWLREAAVAKAEPYRSPGLGTDLRLSAPKLVGAGLIVDDHPVHLELFAVEPAQDT